MDQPLQLLLVCPISVCMLLVYGNRQKTVEGDMGAGLIIKHTDIQIISYDRIPLTRSHAKEKQKTYNCEEY